MQGRRETGGSTVAALVLLLAIAAAGAWNYQRNIAAAAEVYRPFRTHSDQDLALLSGALTEQSEQVAAQYGSAAAQRVTARDHSHYDQRLRELERVQRASKNKKLLQGELARSNTTLKLVAEEEHLRAGESDRVKHFFKLLLTI